MKTKIKNYPKSSRERRINVAEEVLKECFEIKSLAMKNIEMLELMKTVQNGLRIFNSSFLLLLKLDQEPLKVIDAHHPILGVAVEQLLDLLRRLRHGEAEASAETEADSVSLLGHGGH